MITWVILAAIWAASKPVEAGHAVHESLVFLGMGLEGDGVDGEGEGHEIQVHAAPRADVIDGHRHVRHDPGKGAALKQVR
ncbi:MAG: hypothetical protein O7A64_00090, partial [Alphaproteobacteria bacterium]|nr:hypothetical protein [Alphaproteobacteria bacterium]